MAKKADLTGRVFSRLTVIKENGRSENDKAVLWLCRCECGVEKNIRANFLVQGRTRSCGCLIKERFERHLKKRSEDRIATDENNKTVRLYRIHEQMKRRCYDKKNKSYHNYGGRGIRVCEEWLKSFRVFREWALKTGYNDTLSIDRIDNECNYSPLNCRWATPKQQSRNRRNAHLITYKGETRCMSEWSEIVGLGVSALNYRIYKKGMSIEDAFETPSYRI